MLTLMIDDMRAYLSLYMREAVSMVTDAIDKYLLHSTLRGEHDSLRYILLRKPTNVREFTHLIGKKRLHDANIDIILDLENGFDSDLNHYFFLDINSGKYSMRLKKSLFYDCPESFLAYNKLGLLMLEKSALVTAADTADYFCRNNFNVTINKEPMERIREQIARHDENFQRMKYDADNFQLIDHDRFVQEFKHKLIGNGNSLE
jgi:hypothetical protein